MPSYDFRCKNCRTRFSLHYKSIADYEASEQSCPNCGSEALSRLITNVAIKQPTRDFSKMSSQEMLSVFESGDSRAVGEMFQQVGAASPEIAQDYHEATQSLLKGESMDKVERDLQAKESANAQEKASPPSSKQTGNTTPTSNSP